MCGDDKQAFDVGKHVISILNRFHYNICCNSYHALKHGLSSESGW